MLRKLWILKNLLGKFQPILVLLVFVAFLQKDKQEEVKTHPEIDKACSVTSLIRVVRTLPATSANTHQDSLEQSVLFGW